MMKCDKPADIAMVSFWVCVLLCITVPIFFGIFFGIYFPFVHREWEDATCRITGIKQYE